MIKTWQYLILQRERPHFLGPRFYKVWAKRAFYLIPLLRSVIKIEFLKLRGAQISDLCSIESIHIAGSLRNLQIGAGSAIGNNVSLAIYGKLTVGRNVVINSNSQILTATHNLQSSEWEQYHRPITIEDNVWIATGAVILPGVSIGEGAVVGAGAVVRTNIPPRSIVIGNPAVVAGRRTLSGLTYVPSLFCAPFEAWVGKSPAREKNSDS